MKTTKDFLYEVRAKIVREGYPSTKYRVAKVLGVSEQTIGNWDAGKTMDDASAARVADYLGYDSGYVRLCMAWERAPNARAKLDWEKLAKKVGPLAAAVLLAACAPLLLDQSAFDITQCFALLVGYVPVPTNHYANYPALAGGLFLAWVCAWTLAKRRICSARSQ